MGAAHSSVEPRYARIWDNLSGIQSPEGRYKMLETLLAGPEYVAAAKKANVSASLLQWKAALQRGEYAVWPTTATAATAATAATPLSNSIGYGPRSAVQQSQPHYPTRTPTLQISDGRQTATTAGTALARIAPPKRALDALNEAYDILQIDDTKPLTHEALRASYKRAALAAHPDKGGSEAAFDAVTKAFFYVQEVLEKLLPKTATDGTDVRFTAPVTKESALQARGMPTTKATPAPASAFKLEDRPPVALNPKKLDMTVFNKLFEENRLPDPEKDDGYGDWLKTQEERGPQQKMRGKYNADVFNKMFETEAKKPGTTSTALNAYRPPSELTLAPGFGAELGSDRPAQYTKAPAASGIGYTDLKFAYGEGSTFSQEVATVSMDGRPKNLEEAKRAYGSAPSAMTAEQAAAVAAFDRAKEHAEEQRRRRLAAHDVNAESAHDRMKSRLMINN